MTAAASLPVIAHVPMALSVQASTLMTVVAETSKAYSELGGRSVALLSDNRDVEVPGVENVYVDYTRNCSREWFTRRELAADVACGWCGLLRPHYGHMYDPAIEAAEASDADVVLLYEGHYASATTPRWAPVRARAELCLYVHNPLSRSYGRRELQRLLDSCDRIAFCSTNLRDDVVRRLGHDDSRFAVVPNGVDDIFFAHGDRERPDEVRVVYVGRVAQDKGVGVLFDAVEQLGAQTSVPVHLRVVGSARHGGAELSEFEVQLRERARTMDVEVTFLGWQQPEEIAAELGAATVVAIPSLLPEGFSLTALEAMAAGAPVVASDSPGIDEALGGCGLVSPRGDASALARNLLRVVTDDDLWYDASVRGRKRAAEFSWRRTAAGLANL